jgi:hypothetical protein
VVAHLWPGLSVAEVFMFFLILSEVHLMSTLALMFFRAADLFEILTLYCSYKFCTI